MIYEHRNDGGHFFWSGGTVNWVLAVLVADINISVQALKACQTGASENIHENGSHHEADYEDNSSWWEWVVDFLELCYLSDDEVADKSVCQSNGESTEEVNQGTDTVSDEESSGVLKSKNEGSNGGRAETVTGKSNLDIGILVNEFDESVEAIEAASDAIHHDFDSSVLLIGGLHLLIEELESNSDHPDDSKDERAEGERSKVVSDGPPKSSRDRKGASSLAGRSEIPSADATNENIREDGLQELSNPEECENMDVGHVFLFLAELNSLELGTSLWLSNRS